MSPPTTANRFPRWTAAMLRRDLSVRAQALARAQGLLHDVSAGASPAVVFGHEDGGHDDGGHDGGGHDGGGRHGNFHAGAYAKIRGDAEWGRRLLKVHTASRRSRARKDWRWMELDSANSSDALLMNVFCHPEVFDGVRLAGPVARLLNVEAEVRPCFGTRPGVPMQRSRVDTTEIDLVLGSLYVEAKLTESDFQAAPLSKIERYRDLEEVFDVGRLPRKVGARRQGIAAPGEDDAFLNVARRPVVERVQGYQLVRNVLAAWASEAAFCVLCDARRQDLIETWYGVMAAVHAPGFSWRLKLLTWQELAAVLPGDLREFLEVKYGIGG